MFIAPVEDVKKKRRKELRSSTRTTTTSYQFLAKLSKKVTVVVPNMDLLSGNECNARQGKCCKKAGQKKHGEHSSILTIPKVFVRNWLDRVENYFDKTALEDHSYVETRSDRIQDTKQLGTQIESRRSKTSND